MRATRQVENWFAGRKWKVFPFQKQAWKSFLTGQSGLIHATTGTGKTLAAWLGPVIEALAEAEKNPSAITDSPLKVLWMAAEVFLAAAGTADKPAVVPSRASQLVLRGHSPA